MLLPSTLKHLRTIRSVSWPNVLHCAFTLPLDYLLAAGTTRSLVNITLELTYRCNMNCDFCMLKNETRRSAARELRFPDLKALVDQVQPAGLGFFITGGEPFLHPDCTELIEYIKKTRLKCGINTNGLLLTPPVADRLLAAGTDYVIISLHDADVTHKHTIREDAFKRVTSNLRYLAGKKSWTSLLVNSVISPTTLDCMTDMVDSAADCQVDAITFQHMRFLTPKNINDLHTIWSQTGGDAPLSYNLMDQKDFDLAKIEKQVARAKERAAKRDISIFFKPNLDSKGLHTWYKGDGLIGRHCLYLYTDVRINPAGDVHGCQFIQQKMGNIREQPLPDIINNEKYRKFRQAFRQADTLLPACGRCCKLYRTL